MTSDCLQKEINKNCINEKLKNDLSQELKDAKKEQTIFKKQNYVFVLKNFLTIVLEM